MSDLSPRNNGTDQRAFITRLAAGIAPLATGLLAGALFYGWANVEPTFAAVPLEVHLSFRTTLMRQNGIVMQALMAIAFSTSIWLAVAARGKARICAAGAALLVGVTFLVTRFGNVPIHAEMKAWAAGALAANYQDRLETWRMFNDVRVATAVGAFVLLLVAADLVRHRSRPGRADSAARPEEVGGVSK
jgi:uncharacterized membrane protein